MNILNRAAVALATVGIAVTAVPASAAFDPEANATPAATTQSASKPLSRKALKLVWCVKPTGAPAEAKPECKSREAWIKAGKDPFAKN